MGNGDIVIREAVPADIPAVTRIYNQGIEDRIATLEEDPKSEAEMGDLFAARDRRYALVVAENNDREIIGWASLNPYSHRCAYAGVADLSIYVERAMRGKGVGERLLAELEERAGRSGFHKIVLFTFPFNEGGQRLYRKRGYREVGTFREQGKLEDRFIDVLAMEKIL